MTVEFAFEVIQSLVVVGALALAVVAARQAQHNHEHEHQEMEAVPVALGAEASPTHYPQVAPRKTRRVGPHVHEWVQVDEDTMSLVDECGCGIRRVRPRA